MATDKHLIAPINSGLITALPSWQIPEDAFAQLNNAYVFRGRVTKRVGTQLMGTGASSTATAPLLSRLRINIGTTDGSGNISVTVPGNIFNVGQQFSIGTEIFTVYQTGTPAVMLDTGAATVKTFNTTTGAVVINGAAAATIVYWYPSQPVMGICNYDDSMLEDEPTYAFDTQFAYQYVTTSWQELGNLVLQGSNLNYVWTLNWINTPDANLLYITNFNAAHTSAVGGTPSLATDDPMYYWNGSTWTPLTGAATFAFLPGGNARTNSPYVFSCLIMVQFHNRMLLLNTIENNNSAHNGLPGSGTNTWYPQRCRYSFIGSPLAVNAWYQGQQQDNAGNKFAGAGFKDAATKEEIVSAEFVKDRLIVYFERSTWEILYTNNDADPFLWQQINTELGSMSTFSVVPFDKVTMAIGDTGVHACNGANVERIDEKIPDNIFTISKQNSGAMRVAGIRDYFVELVYWCYPSVSLNSRNTNRFPDKLLVYNYQNATWSIWDDTFTAFGYFFQSPNATWAQLNETPWEEYELAWDEGVQYQQSRRVVAGNQQGYMLLFQRDYDVNAQSCTITNATVGADGATITFTVIDHTLEIGDFIYVLELNGITGFVTGIFQVITIINANSFTGLSVTSGMSGTYTGGGTFFTVSQVNILSKQWNPYLNDDRSFYLQYIDFCVQKTATSQITVDYYSSSSNYSTINAATATGTQLGTNILETSPYALVPFEQVQDLLWHRIYFQIGGQFIQIRLYWTQQQMMNSSISLEDFTMEGLILATQPTSYTMEF